MSENDRIQPLPPPPVAVPSQFSQACGDPIESAPFFRDPAFQEFYRKAQSQAQTLEDLCRVFEQGRYRINGLDALRGVHDDAFFLYDVVEGKRRLSELLAIIEKGGPRDVFVAILVDLHHFLALHLSELVKALRSAPKVPQ